MIGLVGWYGGGRLSRDFGVWVGRPKVISSEGHVVNLSMSCPWSVMLVVDGASEFWVESSSGALAGGRSNCTREGLVPPKIWVEVVDEKSGRVVLGGGTGVLLLVLIKGGFFPRIEDNIPIPCLPRVKKDGVEGVTIPFNRLVIESTVSSSSS